MEGKYYSTPTAPPLPSYHLADDFGFTSIRIDHAGPGFVKNIYESDGIMYKAYITVITCTVTRAIHLELIPDLNADSLIRALKRFKGKRGIPVLVVSDKHFFVRTELIGDLMSPMPVGGEDFLKYV